MCRELTKLHEEVVRGSAVELAERYAGAPPKGEVVLVLGPASAAAGGGGERGGEGEPGGVGGGGVPGAEPSGLDALRRLVEAGAHPRKAAGVVAELTGGSANALYKALTSSKG